MSGSDSRRSLRSFVSVLVLCVSVYMYSAGYLHCRMVSNMIELKKDLADLDRQSFIECLVMQRIKYALETMDYNETPLLFEDCVIYIRYEIDEAYADFIFPEYSLERHYEYDSSAKILWIRE